MDINEREQLFHTKFLHQKNTVDLFKNFNFILLLIYYTCILVIIYLLFTKYNLNIYYNIIISLLLVFYPLIAYYIEQKIYNLSQYIGVFIKGTPIDE